MSGHTPGPWLADDGEGGDWVVAAESDGDVIAPLFMATGHYDDAKANAYLIAAAPDLLAALRDLMPLMAECDCINSDRQQPLCPCRAARAAIAKAATGDK